MKPIIRVRGLGKRYRIGERAAYGNLRESITNSLAGLRSLRRNRNGESTKDCHIWALKDIDLDVMPGEVLGIIGRNGAGKSTLLKILSRITEPTEGRVDLYGRVGSLLEVGTGFHPELTGRENIYLNAAILGMKRAEINRKFEEIVDFAELERFIDTPVKRYSSGMYVRLAFAVAAHLEPEILLVDEVLAVGDAAFHKKCLGKIGEIGDHGRTVLMVSHNLPSLTNLCGRGALFDQGTLVLSGNATTIVQRYLSSLTLTGGKVTWLSAMAPGNDCIRLLSVQVSQRTDGIATAEVDISKDIFIALTFRTFKTDARLLPAIWLRDHLGAVVLASNNLPSISAASDPWHGKSYPIGTFRSVCRIPANLLNEGMYSVTVLVNVDITKPAIRKEDVLSFQVRDTGTMCKEYFGAWPGTVKVRLDWNTNPVDSV